MCVGMDMAAGVAAEDIVGVLLMGLVINWGNLT